VAAVERCEVIIVGRAGIPSRASGIPVAEITAQALSLFDRAQLRQR
jgi:hypothetical protein